MSEEDNYSNIRAFIKLGAHNGVLGKWNNPHTGRTSHAYWIDDPKLVGIEHNTGDRMVVSIENYRLHIHTPGYREAVQKFDELKAQQFPERKQLMRRSAASDVAADAQPGGLLDVAARMIADEQVKPSGRKLLRPPSERGDS